MSAKPTTTNARYSVREFPAKRSDRQQFALEENNGYICGIVRESWFYDWGWFIYNDEAIKGKAPTAQAAMDALVAAYEATLGSGEAGE